MNYHEELLDFDEADYYVRYYRRLGYMSYKTEMTQYKYQVRYWK